MTPQKKQNKQKRKQLFFQSYHEGVESTGQLLLKGVQTIEKFISTDEICVALVETIRIGKDVIRICVRSDDEGRGSSAVSHILVEDTMSFKELTRIKEKEMKTKPGLKRKKTLNFKDFKKDRDRMLEVTASMLASKYFNFNFKEERKKWKI